MKQKIDKIVDLVYKVSWSDISEKQYTRTFNTIRKLTGEVWANHHSELLRGLEKLDNPKADYPLFWLECLGFPRRIPNLLGLDGSPLSLNFGALPTDFNQLNFHDSKLLSVISEKEKIKMLIELDSWEQNHAELTFYGASSTFHLINDETVLEHLNEVSDFTILSECEAPLIEYCIKHLKLPSTALENRGKRLFCIFGFQKDQPRDSLYVLADSWSLRTY
jgi:hypothetical protein